MQDFLGRGNEMLGRHTVALGEVGQGAAFAEAIKAAVSRHDRSELEAAGLRNAAKVLFNASDMAKSTCNFYLTLN